MAASGTPAPPEAVKNFSTWGSFAKNVILPIAGALFGGTVFGLRLDWIVGVSFVVAVVAVTAFNYFTRSISTSTQTLADRAVAVGIPTNDLRQQIADHLLKLGRRYRTAVISCLTILFLIFLAPASYWGWQKWRTEAPKSLDVERADFFDPTKHKYILTKSPFLEAVIGDLGNEGQLSNEKYQIVFLTTEALKHPTPSFKLNIYFEQSSYDIAGYAFRQKAGDAENIFEAIPVSYAIQNQITLDVPQCNPGDRIFVVGRIWLNDSKGFPSNLAERIRTKVIP